MAAALFGSRILVFTGWEKIRWENQSIQPLELISRGQFFPGNDFSFFCDPCFPLLEFVHLGLEVLVVGHDIERQPFDFF